ncbi:hypothetical protein Smic_44070 [Streptomyces microflavus]|uniref:Major facilitator superfamily (MFS) profile domain-containing protein n=1 Tax=Streptomyces microflavus TaxID=1919 RepID=A0A7J0CTK8_STRMI|nr:hypothetical protein Smic_44070 [Streptomyces microflavus]
MSVAGLRTAARETVSGLPREFWWLWLSTLVNRLGAFVATFMALYLTLDRGYSASYAGLVAALHGLGGVISSLGAGVMTDRLGRRPTMLIAQLSTAVSVAVLGFMVHPFAIAGVAFLVGMASNASRPAVQAMMADIVPPRTACGPSRSTTGPSTSGSRSRPPRPGSSPSTATSPASSARP